MAKFSVLLIISEARNGDTGTVSWGQAIKHRCGRFIKALITCWQSQMAATLKCVCVLRQHSVFSKILLNHFLNATIVLAISINTLSTNQFCSQFSERATHWYKLFILILYDNIFLIQSRIFLQCQPCSKSQIVANTFDVYTDVFSLRWSYCTFSNMLKFVYFSKL